MNKSAAGDGATVESAGGGSRCPLTPRELEVLRLMADGLTTKAIAAELNVRFKTASCHRSRILQKLSVDSTVPAVRWAIREGIIAP